MCGGNRTGSLGNSAAVQRVGLVNFSAFSPASSTSLSPPQFFALGICKFSVMATGGEPSGVTAAQLKELMTSMQQSILDEMASMKRELSTEREAANEKLVKRLKLEKAPVFKQKGNERQYRHNEEVWLKVTDAATALCETPRAVEKTKTLLEEGEKLILDRQKHIRIADRSENGWATLDKYVEDELADGSDDEKRLSRADARAGKKLKAQKSGRGMRKPNHLWLCL